MTDFVSDHQLGAALSDLGSELWLPTSPIWADVSVRLDGGHAPRRARRVLVAIALVVALLLAATLSIAPARRAVANFLGIGSTEVRRADRVPPGAATPALPGEGDVETLRADLAAAGLLLPDPARVGPPRAWIVEPGGESVVAFDEVVFSQRPVGEIPATKLVPRDASIEAVRVGTLNGLWIGGGHTRVVEGHVYRSESALLWLDHGLELRLEGDLPLDRMLRVARSVRPVA